MPVRLGRDKRGRFYRWGGHGKKYYFKTARAGKLAKIKAARQGRAVEWREHA